MASHRHRSRHAQEPPPPSTLKVLSYVALLWIAWGIFTRIDETEHLRPPASLRNAAHVASHAAHYAQSALHDGERVVEDGLRGAWDGYEGMKRSDDGVYSLAFPRTPAINNAGPSSSRGWIATAFFGITKVFTYAIVYPSIAIFNTASFILHYLSITFFMFLTSAYYLSWPLHQFLSTILATLTAPLSLFTALIRYTEPLWTLAGGLIGASATLGGAFAWIGSKADVRIQEAHEHRRERQRLETLERELARERERADEQERRAREMQVRAIAAAAAYPGRRIPARVEPRSLLSVIVDKVFGRVSVQDEYEAYYADLELLEPRALAQAVAWRDQQQYGEGFGSGDEEERDGIGYSVRAGSRLMIASADSGSKRRHARRPSATRTVVVPQQVMHQHYRAPVRHGHQPSRSTYIPDLHHHTQDDALPAVHTPPMDSLPPTPRKSRNAAEYAGQAPFMTFPTSSLVRRGRGGADRAASSGGRRIMFEDEVGRIAREEVEDEPVEGEVFGLEEDDDGDAMQGDEDVHAFDRDRDQDDTPPAPSSVHIHFHNTPPSATTNRIKRRVRIDEPQIAPSPSGGTVDHAYLGDKYDTPFKRSSARAVRGAQQAFEGGERLGDGENGPAGLLFGQEVGLRARESEMEL